MFFASEIAPKRLGSAPPARRALPGVFDERRIHHARRAQPGELGATLQGDRANGPASGSQVREQRRPDETREGTHAHPGSDLRGRDDGSLAGSAQGIRFAVRADQRRGGGLCRPARPGTRDGRGAPTPDRGGGPKHRRPGEAFRDARGRPTACANVGPAYGGGAGGLWAFPPGDRAAEQGRRDQTGTACAARGVVAEKLAR